MLSVIEDDTPPTDLAANFDFEGFFFSLFATTFPTKEMMLLIFVLQMRARLSLLYIDYGKALLSGTTPPSPVDFRPSTAVHRERERERESKRGRRLTRLD